MAKTDCHFYKPNCCKALTKMLCNSGKCSFYKTEERYQADLKKYPPIDYKSLYESRHKGDETNG